MGASQTRMSNLIYLEIYYHTGMLFISPNFLSTREQKATKFMVIISLFFYKPQLVDFRVLYIPLNQIFVHVN